MKYHAILSTLTPPPQIIRFMGFFVIISMFFQFLIPTQVFAAHMDRKNSFPRLANYYLHAGPSINPTTYGELASFDVLILAMEAQEYNKDFFAYARKKNPNIIILPYVPSRSINILDIEDGAKIRKRLKEGIRNEWYLRDSKNTIVTAWPGTIPVNVATGWNSYLPTFVNEIILSTNLWDGIFYDEVQDDMTYLNSGDIDLDSDTKRDSQDHARMIWKQGNEQLFANTRKLIGEHKLIVINGSSLSDYQSHINGRMFENFPGHSDINGRWADTMSQYLSLPTCSGVTALCIINTNTNNTNVHTDYRKFRFGYISSLMGDGYYSFDYGDQNHGQIWLYDEYKTYLGHAKSDIETLKKEKITSISQGVIRREFEKGIALLNATDERKQISLGEEYEKISGTQDTLHNDGSITSSFTIQPHDGFILLRPLDFLPTLPFRNGSFAKVLREDGSMLRNGFFAYDPTVRGSAVIAHYDLNNDGTREKIIIDKGVVTLISEQSGIYLTFQPFGTSYTEGISLAFGDTDLDGVSELLMAPSPTPKKTTPKAAIKKQLVKKSKYANRKVIQRITKKETPSVLKEPSSIKIFDGQTGILKNTIVPFGKKYKGDISLAVYQPPKEQVVILAGAGFGLKPEIKFLSSDGTSVKNSLFAYSSKFKGGVRIASGDLDGDGTYEIITGAGVGGSPHVRIFDFASLQLKHEFFAYSAQSSSGVWVGAVDIDGDGTHEIIALTSDVFTTAAFK